LFRNREAVIKIFDDCFEVEGGAANGNAPWASPDYVGARFEFEREVLDCRRSVSEFQPGDEKFNIGAAVM
jgi:hypothetical protein